MKYLKKFLLSSLKKGIILMMGLFAFANMNAQISIDLSMGSHFSKLKLHHPMNLEYDDRGFDQIGTQYYIGLTGTIYKQFKLRTEIGYQRSHHQIDAEYDFYNGAPHHLFLHESFQNEKVFLAILPEYRTGFEYLSFFVHGGLVLAADTSNSFPRSNEILHTENYPRGIKIGIGGNANIGDCGFRVSFGYLSFTKSDLIHFRHPLFSTKQLNAEIGFVYNLKSVTHKKEI